MLRSTVLEHSELSRFEIELILVAIFFKMLCYIYIEITMFVGYHRLNYDYSMLCFRLQIFQEIDSRMEYTVRSCSRHAFSLSFDSENSIDTTSI